MVGGSCSAPIDVLFNVAEDHIPNFGRPDHLTATNLICYGPLNLFLPHDVRPSVMNITSHGPANVLPLDPAIPTPRGGNSDSDVREENGEQ